MSYANVIVHVERILNREYRTYEWDGDPRGILCVSLDAEHIVPELPWKLKYVGEDLPWTSHYIRTDVNFWWLTDFRIRLDRYWQKVNQRLLMTLAIWGFLKWHPAVSLRWRDLFKK